MPHPELEDAEVWLAALRAAYERSLSEGAEQWRRASTAAKADAASARALAEAALLALESMTPDDPTSLGMSACEALRVHGGSDHVERMRAVRPTLPARKGLRDWRVDAARALAVVEARASGRCPCSAEAAHGAPVHGEPWAIESETVDRERYCVTMRVRCTRCDTRWTVQRDDGYHYPTFSWTKEAPRSATRGERER